jgi:sulfate adenylyltransferase subunit 2
MLRTYTDEAISEKTKKCYPLSTYKNADVLRYIEERHLIKPETYGGERQSSGTDITDIHYLLYLRERFPDDLRRLLDMYPMAERTLFEFDNREENEHQEISQ